MRLDLFGGDDGHNGPLCAPTTVESPHHYLGCLLAFITTRHGRRSFASHAKADHADKGLEGITETVVGQAEQRIRQMNMYTSNSRCCSFPFD